MNSIAAFAAALLCPQRPGRQEPTAHRCGVWSHGLAAQAVCELLASFATLFLLLGNLHFELVLGENSLTY